MKNNKKRMQKKHLSVALALTGLCHTGCHLFHWEILLKGAELIVGACIYLDRLKEIK